MQVIFGNYSKLTSYLGYWLASLIILKGGWLDTWKVQDLFLITAPLAAEIIMI